MSLARLRKGLRLLARPRLAAAYFRHRVAAAVEHIEPIRYIAAETLIDVGANKGQFSLAFRSQRPHARIIAFEPLPRPGDVYGRLFRADPNVALHRVALDECTGVATFFVADRDDSSSLLPLGQGQAQAFDVRTDRTIEVDVRTLADCVSLADLPHPIMLKIDVQGGELRVLKGCQELETIDYIYTELSFVELYENQPLFEEIAAYLQGRGFALVGVFNQTITEHFGPTQADFLFSRSGGPRQVTR